MIKLKWLFRDTEYKIKGNKIFYIDHADNKERPSCWSLETLVQLIKDGEVAFTREGVTKDA